MVENVIYYDGDDGEFCSEDIINNFQCPMEPYRDGGPDPTEYMGRCQNVEGVEETFTARQEM